MERVVTLDTPFLPRGIPLKEARLSVGGSCTNRSWQSEGGSPLLSFCGVSYRDNIGFLDWKRLPLNLTTFGWRTCRSSLFTYSSTKKFSSSTPVPLVMCLTADLCPRTNALWTQPKAPLPIWWFSSICHTLCLSTTSLCCLGRRSEQAGQEHVVSHRHDVPAGV